MAQPLQLRARNSNWSVRDAASSALSVPPRAAGGLEAACFEAHPDPQFVVDANFEVVALNRAARELLELANGPRGLAESLVAGSSDFLRGVRAAIAAAIHTQTSSGEIELSLPRSLSFTVRVMPLGPASERALVILHPREARASRPPRERFRFTPMECRVVDLLCSGLTASQIAQQLGISIETVRCHLKQAFVKAGVHRQAELVAVMLGR